MKQFYARTNGLSKNRFLVVYAEPVSASMRMTVHYRFVCLHLAQAVAREPLLQEFVRSFIVLCIHVRYTWSCDHRTLDLISFGGAQGEGRHQPCEAAKSDAM